jgi:hypothetical protein
VTSYTLGVNTCFAATRWPRPAEWAPIVRERLELDLVQHSLDLVALDGPAALRRRQADEVRVACRRFGLSLHSTLGGVSTTSSSLLLDPDADVRAHAEGWYRRAIAFTAEAGGRATGGRLGAFSVADAAAHERREELGEGLRRALGRLAGAAWRAGLEAFLVENGASAREPSTIESIGRLLAPPGPRRVSVALCLDVGHKVASGTRGVDHDPYAWLVRMGSRAAVVQLQQSDADRVFAALDRSGAEEVVLILEVTPPVGQDDDRVLADLEASASYWRNALHTHAARLGR